MTKDEGMTKSETRNAYGHADDGFVSDAEGTAARCHALRRSSFDIPSSFRHSSFVIEVIAVS
jgi:hypothetical protein